MLTTEAIICERKDGKPSAPMGGHGGMDM
jgi:hypothetical protein